MSRIRVIVRLRPEVLDPQGKTIGHVLRNLGYGRLVRVHAGKVFDLEWEGTVDEEARRQIREIAERVLSNPLIETYEIQWSPDEETEGS